MSAVIHCGAFLVLRGEKLLWMWRKKHRVFQSWLLFLSWTKWQKLVYSYGFEKSGVKTAQDLLISYLVYILVSPHAPHPHIPLWHQKRINPPDPGITADSCPQQTVGSQKQQKIPQCTIFSAQKHIKMCMLNTIWIAEKPGTFHSRHIARE